MAKKHKKNESACCSVKRKTSIGGQALMEGIMMRGPAKTAMAVRDPQGEIVFEEWENKKNNRPKITKLPVIRGVFGFIDSMVTGYKALMRSAELSGLEEAEAELEREKQEKKAQKATKKAEKRREKHGEAPVTAEVSEPASATAESTERADTAEKSETTDTTVKDEATDKTEKKKTSALIVGIMVAAVVLAVLLMVVLFIWFPTFVFDLLTKAFPQIYQPETHPALASLVKSAFEGCFKVVLLVGYMSLVSLMKEIRRTFQYHGAEHKTIFCYEHGKALTVENVRGERRFHPRCGTSFLILMVLVSIFVCFFIDPIAIWLTGAPLVQWLRTLVRLILWPLIMGIGYEVLKLAGRKDNLFTRIVSAPGMWLQHITVREPEDDMIECAIKAFIAVIPEEELEEELAKIAAETPKSTDSTDSTESEASEPSEGSEGSEGSEEGAQ